MAGILAEGRAQVPFIVDEDPPRLRRVLNRYSRQGSTLLRMGSAVWLASAAGLVGIALGGLVSLAVNRQQIREARALRADEASQERYRRSVDRRFKAFSEFIIQHRAARGALQFYYSQLDGKPSPSDINKALRSARDSAAMVFLVQKRKEPIRLAEACTAETTTILPVLQKFQERHGITGMVVVADAGLLPRSRSSPPAKAPRTPAPTAACACASAVTVFAGADGGGSVASVNERPGGCCAAPGAAKDPPTCRAKGGCSGD